MGNVVRTVCQSCHQECGVLVHIDEGKITKIQGDPTHPASKGFICMKGINAFDVVRHPNRVVHPLKRAGSKGGGKWIRISWDDALGEIAAKLTKIHNEHGSKAIGTFHGTAPRQSLFFARLMASAMGTPNVSNTDLHICYGPSMVGEFATFGHSIMQEQGPDYVNAKCILVVGGNPLVSHPARGLDLLRGVTGNDAKLIVVDPRQTKLAARAHTWFQIRPGTDQALILALLQVIISEELYSREFVDKYCHGFEELRASIMQYTPEWASSITWIAADRIRETARMFARIKPAAVHHRVAVEQNINSTQCIRALGILVAITGNLGSEGGNLLPASIPGFVSTGAIMGSCKVSPEVAEERLGGKQYPLIAGKDPLFTFVHPALLAKSMMHGDPYPIRALLLAGGNPVVNMQNTKRTWEAFKCLELSVVLDFFRTPTVETADYILPTKTWLERDDCCDEMYLDCISARQETVSSPPECRDDLQIAIDLVRRLPWANRKYIPWASVTEFNDYRVKGMGMTFEEFKEKGHIALNPENRAFEKKGFRTPTGKVELYSTIFAANGHDPLPFYKEPPQSPVSTPELLAHYPYILVTGGRTMQYYLSEGRQIESLRKQMPYPLIEMHPDSAKKEDLQDGDWVWVETPMVKGERIKLKVKVTTDFDPRVVHAQQGWWFPERETPDHGCFESNINVILSDDPPREAVCGSVPLRGTLCKLYKVAQN